MDRKRAREIHDTYKTDWWCPRCEEYLDGSRVTQDETCDTCGHGVRWGSPKDDENRALLVAAEAVRDCCGYAPEGDACGDCIECDEADRLLALAREDGDGEA